MRTRETSNSLVRYLSLGIISSTLLAGVSEAAAYYVAKAGSDSYSCAQAQGESTPRLTINAGLACLASGDTLYIKAGTYPESINNGIPSGSSWSSPTTVAHFGTDVVVLNPSGSTHVVNLTNRTAYVVIDGLILDGMNAQGDGVVFQWSGTDLGTAAHHIRVKDCEIRNAKGQGVRVDANSYGCEAIRCKIYNNGTDDFDHGLYWKGAYGLIDACDIHDNSGWGVHVYNGSYAGTYPTNNVVVRNNRIYNNARAGQRGAGIVLGSGSGSTAYNNVIHGNGGGVQVDFGASGATVYNNTIYNNKSGSSGYAGILIGGGSSGAIIRNNIVYLNNGTVSNTGSGTILSNNATQDPLFVNGAAGDFRLQNQSPAIDAGTVLSQVSTDLEGKARPQGAAFDVGAYEYGGAQATPVTNLRIVGSN